MKRLQRREKEFTNSLVLAPIEFSSTECWGRLFYRRETAASNLAVMYLTLRTIDSVVCLIYCVLPLRWDNAGGLRNRSSVKWANKSGFIRRVRKILSVNLPPRSTVDVSSLNPYCLESSLLRTTLLFQLPLPLCFSYFYLVEIPVLPKKIVHNLDRSA